MSDLSDLEIIRKFAAGDTSLRDQAIAAYHHDIKMFGPQGTPEQNFMAQVDKPYSDPIMRGHYREALLQSLQPPASPRYTVTELSHAIDKLEMCSVVLTAERHEVHTVVAQEVERLKEILAHLQGKT